MLTCHGPRTLTIISSPSSAMPTSARSLRLDPFQLRWYSSAPTTSAPSPSGIGTQRAEGRLDAQAARKRARQGDEGEEDEKRACQLGRRNRVRCG